MGESDNNFVGNKYVLDSASIKTGQGTWDVLEVTVSKLVGDVREKVGSYKRNYPDLFSSFFPFVHEGKEYALYSPSYMFTRVMELPSCADIGGEDQTNVKSELHFCPVEFYIPCYRKITFPKIVEGEKLESWLKGDDCFNKEYDDGKNILGPVQYCDFGFVAGCVWGDDTSWKIQFLDLSEVEKGIIKRDARFGYVQLPNNLNLKQAIDMRLWEPDHPVLGISHTTVWNYLTKEKSCD